VTDYDEWFFDVNESFPSGHEVCLEMDVDTTGGYVTVTVHANLYAPDGYWVDEYYGTWTIHSEDSEWGSVCLIAWTGGTGWYEYHLELYDDQGIYEDSWSGSVYLSAQAPVIDYDEDFYDVSESFPSGIEVCLDMDVDTTGGYETVTVYARLCAPSGYPCNEQTTTWTIHGEDIEYGTVCLSGVFCDAGGCWWTSGWHDYYLELYDDQGHLEHTRSGSVSLCCGP